jgi:hypothetical protein
MGLCGRGLQGTLAVALILVATFAMEGGESCGIPSGAVPSAAQASALALFVSTLPRYDACAAHAPVLRF